MGLPQTAFSTAAAPPKLKRTINLKLHIQSRYHIDRRVHAVLIGNDSLIAADSALNIGRNLFAGAAFGVHILRDCDRALVLSWYRILL